MTVSPHSVLSTAWVPGTLMKQSPDLYVSHTCTHSFYLPTLFLISKWKQYDIIHSSLCFLLRCSVIYPSFLSSKCGEQFALLVKATLNQKRLFSALVEQQEGIIKLCCTWRNFLLLFPSVGQFTAQPPPEVAQPPPEVQVDTAYNNIISANTRHALDRK